MKKIMFDDHYGLTQAVIDGRKTMTRRLIGDIPPVSINGKPEQVIPLHVEKGRLVIGREDGNLLLYAPSYLNPRYKIGETVAIAQPYCDIMAYLADSFHQPSPDYMKYKAGYRNKMFVRADLMPHQIRITSVRIESIQGISDKDCLREGIYLDETAPPVNRPFYTFQESQECGTPVGYNDVKYAFSALIKKLSGKKAWNDNPWVFVYEFELVK